MGTLMFLVRRESVLPSLTLPDVTTELFEQRLASCETEVSKLTYYCAAYTTLSNLEKWLHSSLIDKT